MIEDQGIQGRIPPGQFFSSLTNVRTLSLARNRFTGPMPMSVAKLGTFLQRLDLSGNRLSGRISITALG